MKNYIRTEKTVEILKGKLDFFACPRTFATTVDGFANAKCKVACIDKETKAMIKARKALIDEHETQLALVPDDEAHKAEVARLNTEIDEILSRKRELTTEITASQYGIALDETVYLAYKGYKNGTVTKADYMHEIACWFDANGVKAHEDTIKQIILEIGSKKATNNEIIKSEGKNFISAISKTAYTEMFYRVLADMMAKAGTIKPFNFEKAYYTTK